MASIAQGENKRGRQKDIFSFFFFTEKKIFLSCITWRSPSRLLRSLEKNVKKMRMKVAPIFFYKRCAQFELLPSTHYRFFFLWNIKKKAQQPRPNTQTLSRQICWARAGQNYIIKTPTTGPDDQQQTNGARSQQHQRKKGSNTP